MLVAQQMPLRADWGMQGSCPALLYVRAACSPVQLHFPAACTASYSNGVFGQGCSNSQRGKPQTPGGNAPGGTRTAADNAGKRGGNAERGKPPRETRGLRLFPVGYLHYP